MPISSSDEETLRSDSAQGQRGVGSRHAYTMPAEGEVFLASGTVHIQLQYTLLPQSPFWERTET